MHQQVVRKEMTMQFFLSGDNRQSMGTCFSCMRFQRCFHPENNPRCRFCNFSWHALRIRTAHVHVLAFFHIIKCPSISSYRHTLLFLACVIIWCIGPTQTKEESHHACGQEPLTLPPYTQHSPSHNCNTRSNRVCCIGGGWPPRVSPSSAGPSRSSAGFYELASWDRNMKEHRFISPLIDRGYLMRLYEEFSGLGTSPCPAGWAWPHRNPGWLRSPGM